MMYLLLFLAGLVLDLLWVGYTEGVQKGNAPRAALYSMAMGACSLAAVSSAVTSPVLAVPYVLGLGAGTWLGMRVL